LTTANSKSPTSSSRCSGQFLVDFCTGTARVRPVEADAGGSLLELFGTQQGGQADRHAIQRAGRPLGTSLGRLDLFPKVVTAISFVAEDVRVAAFHLVADRVDDVR
jgi:hypothetical protein